MLNVTRQIWLKNWYRILQTSFDSQMGELLCPGCYKRNSSYLRSGPELARWADLEVLEAKRSGRAVVGLLLGGSCPLAGGRAHAGAQAAEAHKWQGQLNRSLWLVGRLAVGLVRGPARTQWRTIGKPVANQWQTIGIFHWHIPFVLGNEDS